MCRNNGRFWVLAATIMAMMVAGCSTSRPSFEQNFQGVILKGKKPVEAAKVRFLTSKSDGGCDVKGADAVTDKQGRFRMSQKYNAAWLESDDAAVRSYRLCVLANESWEPVWRDVRRTPPQSVDFECDLADRSTDKCWVSWDKDGYKRGSWSR